ncbi:MAG TPA: sigma-70 family RNA polymerase sigma factor [Sedimentisphaerales bacterium]|nr:sigma-70 family RNA polymerase sigma factor [Sedimentisphaerales bacterium]
MVEDKLLLWRFKNGSEDALCRIYQKYRTRLLKLASALSQDTGLAEDIVQDVFVSFAQSARRMKVDGNLRAYLTTSVANRIRNRLRDGRSEQNVNLVDAGAVTSKARTPDQWVVYSENMRKVNDVLKQLPYEQREVVLLHVHGDMKFKSISEIQQVSINTVLSRYRYAVEKLRAKLKE